MKNCRICESALAQPDYRADAPAMTSLSTMIDIGTEVFVCRTCGHVQSPDLPDVQGFYDHDYRISLQSDGHDQLYEMSADGPVFRTTQQARLLEDLDIPIGAKLLDFGAAKAVTTRRFLDRRPDIRPHVFDVSEDYRSFWDEWVPSDAQATYTLPKDWLGHFDLITSHFVLERVADPVSILASLKACLAPDGRLFFTVPDPIENSGDFLVVDHLNHFVPTSLHCALQAADLSVVSARQDLFRGAHVVVAEHRAQDEIADVPDQTADVLALLNDWRHMLDNLRYAVTTPETADGKIAVYGAGFYGNLFSSLAKARIVCFLDRNPHLLGGSVDGKPILSPEDCPSVDLVIAALNPARARDILPPDANWIPKNAQVIYPEARTVTISLVIPTRSRAVYLRETLKTVVIALQACTQQVEVIVSDNASDDETEDVCGQSDIPELTYVRQPNRLSMRQSFEAGLRASTGSHVVFMGDDDAVAPHGLVLLHEMIASGDHDIFKWRIVNYIWPDPDRGRKGGVVLRNNKLSGRVRRIDPKALLADFKTA